MPFTAEKIPPQAEIESNELSWPLIQTLYEDCVVPGQKVFCSISGSGLLAKSLITGTYTFMGYLFHELDNSINFERDNFVRTLLLKMQSA